MDKLTGADYADRPYIELLSHPDWDEDAWRIVAAICAMTNEDLKKVKLFGGKNG